MRTKILLGMALALGSGGMLVPDTAPAQSARAARAKIEGSMVLTGTVGIATDGSVDGFTLDHEDKVDADIRDLVKRTVAQWRFEPVLRDGKAVRAKSPVSLRLAAERADEQRMNVVLKSASFEEYDPKATDSVTAVRMNAPAYPPALFDARGAGVVNLLLRVARDGTVADVVAEQVNMHVVGSERQLKSLRALMERNALLAARKWTFRPPTTGSDVDEDYWTVRVPVEYAIEGSSARYVQWQVFVPGPKSRAPWLSEGKGEKDATDTLVAGGVYQVGAEDKGPRLLTPLG